MKKKPKKFIELLYEQGVTYKPYEPTKEERSFNNTFKKKYGITYDDYHTMLAEQNRVCAICYGVSKNNKKLSVDHCHTTGMVRGLLCDSCNLALGLLKDNILNLEKAIEYLKHAKFIRKEEIEED